MEFRCIFLCDENERIVLSKGLEMFAARLGCRVEAEWYTECSAFLLRLQGGGAREAAVVAVTGALGMEAASGVRSFDAWIPLIWCSNDEGFAVMSYRLNCAMFLTFPLKPEQVENALLCCTKKQRIAQKEK